MRGPGRTAGPAGGDLGAFQALPPDPVHLRAVGPGPLGRRAH